MFQIWVEIMAPIAIAQTSSRTIFRALTAIGMALIFIVASSGIVIAAQDPPGVVGYIGAQGMATLGPGVSAAQRTARLRELFSKYFDVGHVAAFALGHYRGIATAEQQQEYFRLYEEYTAASYGSQLSRIGVAPFQVIGSRSSGDQTVVTSEIVRPDGNRVKLDWYLVNRHGKYKVADVNIGGSSMKITQRDEFARWIESNGGRFDALLAVLRQEIAQTR
jgi:phospholipid transport system substrate-binding protein